jgi:uncharacterized RDD family membrane protein YckC
MNKPLPTHFEGSFDNLYGNFGARFSAVLLDGLMLAPMVLVTIILNTKNLSNYYISFAITTVVSLVYYLYLPVKYGATPGKLLMNLQLLKLDGSAITYKDAFQRYLPAFVLSLIALFVTVVAVSRADAEVYNNLKFLQQSDYISSCNPVMFYSQIGLTYIYLFSNLIVFLTNPRKRSISDLSGNTVVVYKTQLGKIEDFKNNDTKVN